jgi:hypothetical protein
VSQHNDLGTRGTQLRKRGQRGFDAPVVGDAITVEGHVEIAANEDPLTAQVAEVLY